MTIDEFFAEIAGIKLVNTKEDDTEVIRTPSNVCPICALANSKRKYVPFENGQWEYAAAFLGLSSHDADTIVTAADTDAVNISIEVYEVRRRFARLTAAHRLAERK